MILFISLSVGDRKRELPAGHIRRETFCCWAFDDPRLMFGGDDAHHEAIKCQAVGSTTILATCEGGNGVPMGQTGIGRSRVLAWWPLANVMLG